MKKDSVLSFVRVVAMLSIILGHWCTWKGINTFQLGGLGVEIFLLLSGYLYGTKEISNKVTWGKNRVLRLMPSLWITVVIHQVLLIVAGHDLRISSLLLYLFDIQGLNRIIVNVDLPTYLGMGQTWFITVIVVCYFLMTLLKNSKFEKTVDCHTDLFFILSICIQILLAYLGIQLAYIIQFFIGYFLSRKRYWNRSEQEIKMKGRVVAFTTVLMAVMLVSRFALHSMIDGSLFYDRIISRWSFNFLALWIVICLLQSGVKFPHFFERITSNKWWECLDHISYPLFLAHYMFVKGEISVDKWISNIVLQSVFFILLTVIMGTIIYFINNMINSAVKKNMEKHPVK